MKPLNVLTHSRMRTYRACPRRHFLAYELGLRRIRKSTALNIGSAFHAALDAKAKGRDPVLDEMDEYDLAVTAAMITVHDEVMPPLAMVASELAFDLPLVNWSTGRPSRIWRWGGVIDGIALLDSGVLALVERKTTSRDISPGNDYWLNVMRDQQISQYVLAARALGWDVRTVLYDVVRRPLYRPKLATPPEARKYRKDGQLYASQREVAETPEEYAHRMAEVMRADQDKYLQRIEIPRLTRELDATAEDQWIVQKMIRRSQLDSEWPRNPQSCVTPFRCDFLDVCDRSDLDTETPDGFERLEDIHPEITQHS